MGDTTKVNGFKQWVSGQSYDPLQGWLQTPTRVNTTQLFYIAGGFLLVFFLRGMRSNFLWWPFHPAGYALARFPVPGKEILFICLLLALIVPYQALLTPIFFMFAQLRLTNTLVGLAIVHTTIQLPFSVYIMRNSFEAVPRELEEAAVIDLLSVGIERDAARACARRLSRGAA